jgi:predicted dehydrogenase
MEMTMAQRQKRTFGVGLLGTGFMGRAHANAWLSTGRFFDLPRRVERVACASRDGAQADAFARQWDWQRGTADYHDLLADDSVDLIDVCTPNNLHASMSIEALQAGKHVACEKPLAATLADAKKMKDAAAKAKKKGIHSFVWFNYRRVPAVAFAHQLLKKGKLGRIFHVRACYLQDWGHGQTPLVWRFDAKQAGTGAHGDLNAHIIDMTRFILGDEIREVVGAIEERFIDRRSLPGGKKTGKSTVDDCVLFLARFARGAVASFEATRLATGNLNRNTVEINGEKGSIKFDFERMNELQWWDHTLPTAMQGWSRIMCTNAGDHPYIDAYWPPAHGLGYEHAFVSQAADMVKAIAGKKIVVPLPDFADAYETQRVLEAALISAREGCTVPLSKVR